MDYGRCELKRVAPDGVVTTLLSHRQVCQAGDPEHFVRADYMVWDRTRNEMVMGGALLWQKSPKTDLYSTIWRVRPDGTFRRVYLAGKVRSDLPRLDGISGLALDPGGRVVFGTNILDVGGDGGEFSSSTKRPAVPMWLRGRPDQVEFPMPMDR
ncbi:MAG: hypothetical protein NNA20_06890 [Nitrospira sp.]|nr:hypothetical protein [Nitrospira sp.]